MPEFSFAPVQTAAVTATRAGRRLRLRRKRSSTVGAWWRRVKVAMRIERPRCRIDLIKVSIPRAPVIAGAGIGAGGVLLVALRRRASRLRHKAAAAVHGIHSTETAPDVDQALADKVRTEIFRRPDAAKGAVNVSVIDGVVYLRGEVPNLDEAQHLVDDTLAVIGVVGVESMLHTPGTPAPTGAAG